jgi:anti-sigma B factor antagonist
MDFDITATVGGIRVSGAMTVYTASQLKSELLNRLPPDLPVIELNLAAVHEFDTAGLQLLLMLRRHLAGQARALRINDVSQSVDGALVLCSLKSLLGGVEEDRQ